MLPTVHLDKINSAINNEKMPQAGVDVLRAGLPRYHQWIQDMNAVEGDDIEQVVTQMVALFNEYKYFMDFEQVFSSGVDFLYRQRGQLKLDNSIIEEFLPHLVSKCFPDINNVSYGPTKCFSAAYFQTSLRTRGNGGGLNVRTKDQDFAIARKLYIKSSHKHDFEESDLVETHLGYVTAECKTNLDKTMFQEATATAHDVKLALPGSKYFLLCEWLDMTPVSTAPTDIDEVLIMRKAKRINSNIRKNFSTIAGREEKSEWYSNFLRENPFREEVFLRFIGHIESLIGNEDPAENDVLEDGFF
ncbi:TPA: Bpu10I family restriction endonuclease [Vibrio parahaemolyticus]|uniref:Bpu10I family restriction endonuclease n=1 Tax=Vibrio parahaemolyticus TaxID=670 RepID=UPI001C5E3EA3|nr:Bpu10I family restriction endonuclease [Vibrio parahaemolyticus]ELA6661081.1 Bpu10I family restriction endonuclease [Vibrio alginolyticus]EIE1197862.1 Bpu10I family restriction endonuclease [Vibrio parahaemolyticus]EJC6988525.1 Bpu10I family restriction endonuclease [Vibrio parahaemolyticus]EJG1900801.1 Bpu10I family restriction endonuclease [Vibrio parahaemolyticus]ELA7355475.1 Bpu10I family restriction endonuclease [Vibrio alginolyticus]